MGLPSGISVTGARIVNESGDDVLMDSARRLQILNVSQLVPKVYNYLSLTYSGDNITQVIYKNGGASGETVAQLDLTYSGDKILTVTRT